MIISVFIISIHPVSAKISDKQIYEYSSDLIDNDREVISSSARYLIKKLEVLTVSLNELATYLNLNKSISSTMYSPKILIYSQTGAIVGAIAVKQLHGHAAEPNTANTDEGIMEKIMNLLKKLFEFIFSIFASEEDSELSVDGIIDENENNIETNLDENETNTGTNMTNDQENTTNSNEEEDTNTVEAAGSCEEQDHSAITDELVPDFYIPECAILISVSKSASSIMAEFTVEEDWQDIFNAYKEFFGENLTSEIQNPLNRSAILQGNLYEGSDKYTRINIDQSDEYLTIRMINYFPDE